MTMAAPLSAAVSGKTRRIRQGGITALAQSAWMGFPLAADALEPIRSAPAALRHWTKMIRPRRPAGGLALGAVVGLLLLGRLVIRILFERGAFDAAGDLTYRVLVIYAVALPAYIATELITRSLIALRDTRTPLLTNTGQLVGRIAILVALLPSLGVLAIPAAFTLTSTLETLTPGAMLWRKLARPLPNRPSGPRPTEVTP